MQKQVAPQFAIRRIPTAKISHDTERKNLLDLFKEKQTKETAFVVDSILNAGFPID